MSYCVVNGQVAIFKWEHDEIVTLEPIKGIEYLFEEKDPVEITTGGNRIWRKERVRKDVIKSIR